MKTLVKISQVDPEITGKDAWPLKIKQKTSAEHISFWRGRHAAWAK